jgi:helix-turn-helix protein
MGASLQAGSPRDNPAPAAENSKSASVTFHRQPRDIGSSTVTRRRYCRCGTALAGDNTSPLCSACQATTRRTTAPDVPPEFWRTEAMAAALASGDLGHVIRAYRCHPFHGRRLPQALLAGWLHMSQAAVCRIENDRRRVTIDEIVRIARALGMPIAVPWAAQPEVGEDVDPLSRRSLFGAGAGAALGLGATTAPAVAAREVDPELVSHWVNLLRLLDRHDARGGPHEVLDAVRHEIGLIAAHREVARGELRRQLLRAESRWAQFAGWLNHDAGNVNARDVWADRALRLAREGDYPEMVAYVLMRQGRWAVEDEDARRAVGLAETAQRVSGTTEQVRALCALTQAQGHALAGEETACARGLAHARELLDRADAPQSTWNTLARNEITRPYVLASEARCRLWLRPHNAIATYESALRNWPREQTRTRGVQQARLALACAASGEPERAAAEGRRALEVARTTRSDMTMRELKRLGLRLVGCDAPQAIDFRAALAAA